MAREALGKGLDVILKRSQQAQQTAAAPAVVELPIDRIQPNARQPRKVFDDESLQELAGSIREHGLMQPLLVRALQDNQYELVAGERRWRAAGLAQVPTVAAVVREVSDQETLIFALVENLQREDLNIVDEADALARLQDEFKFTHEEIGAMLGKARPTVTNMLRLRDLPRAVIDLLREEQLNMGHARALLQLKQIDQTHVARRVVNGGMSVRATETLVNKMLGRTGPSNPVADKIDTDPHVNELERELTDLLNAPVSIRVGKRNPGKGAISIKFTSLDELDGILAHLRKRI